MLLPLLVVFLCLTLTSSLSISITPTTSTLHIDDQELFLLTCTNETDPSTNTTLYISTTDSSIVEANVSSLPFFCPETHYLWVTAKGIGIAHIQINDENRNRLQSIQIKVVRHTTSVDAVFNVVLVIMVIFNALSLGCTMDLKLIISHFKKPKKIFIGMTSQFLFMPMIAYTLTKVFRLSAPLALGAIIMGSAPGGGASNWVSYMLGGDLELSIAMTAASTVAAVGFMPMWLVVLASEYTDEDLTIPYAQIAIGLLAILGPTFLGIFFQFKLPRLAAFFESVIPLFGLVAVTTAVGTGIYSNQYLLFYPYKPWLTGFLLPFCGFTCGFIFCTLLRLELPFRITICVETGIQNSILSVTIAELAFEHPLSDDVVAVPLFAALFTGCQTLTAVGSYLLYKRRMKKYERLHDVGIEYDERSEASVDKIPPRQFDDYASLEGKDEG